MYGKRDALPTIHFTHRRASSAVAAAENPTPKGVQYTQTQKLWLLVGG